jgi:hypothetical protein
MRLTVNPLSAQVMAGLDNHRILLEPGQRKNVSHLGNDGIQLPAN